MIMLLARIGAGLGSGLGALLLGVGAAQACAIPAGWMTMKPDGKGDVRAALSKPGAAIEVGQPFAVDIAVCASEEISQVKVDAVMPRHRHGMNYQPTVTRKGGGTYRAEPMLFHMPGLWRIRLKAYRGGKPAYLSLDMTVE